MDQVLRQLTDEEWQDILPFLRDYEEKHQEAEEAKQRLQLALRLAEPAMRQEGVSFSASERAILVPETFGDGFAHDTPSE